MQVNDELLRKHFDFKRNWLTLPEPASAGNPRGDTVSKDRSSLRMHYVDEGVGAPVICVHGNPTWSFYYRDVINALRATHRVIAPDHIGCGLSDKPDDTRYSYTLAQRVADLEALLDHLELHENLSFVVHDWGGMIGLAAALRRRSAVARVVVLNTAAFRNPKGLRLPWPLWFVRNVPWLANPMILGGNAFVRGTLRYGARRPLGAEIAACYRLPYDSWANRRATLRFVQDIPIVSTDASYSLVQWTDEQLDALRAVPMLVCWGRRDFVFDDAFLAEWRTRMPHADVHAFPDAGHLVLEDAREQAIPLISAFVRDARPAVVAKSVAPIGERSTNTDQAVRQHVR